MSEFLTTLKAITDGDPVFVGVTDPTLEVWIALAVVEFNALRWSHLYVQGVAYLAAHKYARGPGAAASGGASTGGAVAARRARNWEIRYNTSSGGSGSDSADEDLRQTSYGLAYLRLRGQTRGPYLQRPSG